MKKQKSDVSQSKSSCEISKEQILEQINSLQSSTSRVNSKANKIRTKLLLCTDAENNQALKSHCMINSRTAIELSSCFEPMEITIYNPMEVGTPSRLLKSNNFQLSTPSTQSEYDSFICVKKLQNKKSISMRKLKNDDSLDSSCKINSNHIESKYECIKKGYKYLQALSEKLKRKTQKRSGRLNSSNSNSNILHPIIKLSTKSNNLGSIERRHVKNRSDSKTNTEDIENINNNQINKETEGDKKSFKKTFTRRHTYTSGKVSSLKKVKASTFKEQGRISMQSEKEKDNNNDDIADESGNNIVLMNSREDDSNSQSQIQEQSDNIHHNPDNNSASSSCIKLISANTRNIGRSPNRLKKK